MPPYYCSTMLSTYDIHNKISFWGHSEAIGFLPYVLAFEAAVPLILWSKCLNFFVPKDFYTCQHDPTKCRSRSINAFFLQSTLVQHWVAKTYSQKNSAQIWSLRYGQICVEKRTFSFCFSPVLKLPKIAYLLNGWSLILCHPIHPVLPKSLQSSPT